MTVLANHLIAKTTFYKYYLFTLWYLNNLFSCAFTMCTTSLSSSEASSCGMKENKNGSFLQYHMTRYIHSSIGLRFVRYLFMYLSRNLKHFHYFYKQREQIKSYSFEKYFVGSIIDNFLPDPQPQCSCIPWIPLTLVKISCVSKQALTTNRI